MDKRRNRIFVIDFVRCGTRRACELVRRNLSRFGHQLPMAVTSKFHVPGGIEWLVFGDQVDRENF